MIAARRYGPATLAAAIVVFAAVVWSVPAGVLVQGALVGSLTALLALGLALVWRSNRIINFAAADLGTVPATLAVVLTISTVAVNWWVGLAAGLVSAVVVGAAVEFLLVRRFARSPRLVLSVATIGIAQVLAACGLFLANRFTVTRSIVPAPFSLHFTISPIVFRGTDVAAFVTVVAVLVSLTAFFQRSDLGIAIRAGAERADRAASLGIPVRRLQTLVWIIATLLAFLAIYLRAGIIGIPIGQVLGPALLLRALAAAVIGRMERFPTIVGAAVVLGIVEQSVVWHWHQTAYVDPVLFVVVVAGLLVTGGPVAGRLRRSEVSSWQAAREVRPIPRPLRSLPEVRGARLAIVAAVAAVLVAVPTVLSASRLSLATAIVIFGIIGCSLVVLTGWAGQVSLGQVALVGVGAAVSGAVTARLGWDLAFGLLLAGLVGAVIAIAIGLPALRRGGLTLAVTSLAFALMTSDWLLDRSFFGSGTSLNWLPGEQIARPPLFGVIAVNTDLRFYYLCLAGLVLAAAMAYGLRASRTGRAIIAARENEQAAETFGVNSRRLMLFALGFSGFLAAFAGALFVYQQSGLDVGPYTPTASLQVFAMTVIGGLGSIPGAVIGATYVRGVAYFLPTDWQILATGVGLLAVLLVLPGGLGGALADAREALLRRVARRRRIQVGPATTGDTDRPPAPGTAAAAAPPDARLVASGVVVRYDGVAVLVDARLHVAPGEIVALLGTNGAGKSTFLRVLAGLVRGDAGRVRLDGEDVTRLRADELAARGVASVPGGEATFPSLTVAEHLRLAAWTQRHRPDHAGEATARALEHFPTLVPRSDQPAGSLSGGEQQMLALAMALIAGPRLLLVDELSLGLAPNVVTSLLAVLRELADQGTSVVLVEQSVDLALDVASRASFLEKGTVRFEGPAEDLRGRHDLLRSVFLGDVAGSRTHPLGVAEGRAAPDGTSLRIRGVTKRFGGIVALDDVSLQLRRGEVLGVLGPNGAGKTTLFDVVSGFERPDAGLVELVDEDGRPVPLAGGRPSARAHRGLGRSFQDARLFPALTVEDTLAVALEDWVPVRDPVAATLRLPAVAQSEAEVHDRVDELLGLFHLGDYADRFVRELSTGTRRVVELAALVAARPDVVLLDEPSGGLAQHEVEALVPLLDRVRTELGASLVVIEHDLVFLRAVAPRWIALDLGAVVATGTPDEVCSDPRVIAAYLGQDRPPTRSGA